MHNRAQAHQIFCMNQSLEHLVLKNLGEHPDFLRVQGLSS